jgi:hypothetical protein
MSRPPITYTLPSMHTTAHPLLARATLMSGKALPATASQTLWHAVHLGTLFRHSSSRSLVCPAAAHRVWSPALAQLRYLTKLPAILLRSESPLAGRVTMEASPPAPGAQVGP